MVLSNSLEEYLKTIYLLEISEQQVRVTDIAQKLNCSKPSVNRALKVLKENNLIEYEAYGDILLTSIGKREAKQILRKYDVLKLFLTEVLEVKESVADQEAVRMKHAVSKETVQKLEQYVDKILNLGDLSCDYDETSEKCKNCVKITVKNRLKGRKL